MSGAALILDLAGYYIWAGVAVAAMFLTLGMDRIDPDSRGAYAFRPLLIPGILLIWPLVLWRWWRLERAPEAWEGRYRPPRARPHLIAAIAMGAAIALSLTLSLSLRQSWPADAPATQLSAPEARP